MTAAQAYPGFCQHCECPQGQYTCDACVKDNGQLDIRSWLDRERTKLPGLTNSEVALIERLIADLEASRP